MCNTLQFTVALLPPLSSPPSCPYLKLEVLSYEQKNNNCFDEVTLFHPHLHDPSSTNQKQFITASIVSHKLQGLTVINFAKHYSGQG